MPAMPFTPLPAIDHRMSESDWSEEVLRAAFASGPRVRSDLDAADQAVYALDSSIHDRDPPCQMKETGSDDGRDHRPTPVQMASPAVQTISPFWFRPCLAGPADESLPGSAAVDIPPWTDLPDLDAASLRSSTRSRSSFDSTWRPLTPDGDRLREAAQPRDRLDCHHVTILDHGCPTGVPCRGACSPHRGGRCVEPTSLCGDERDLWRRQTCAWQRDRCHAITAATRSFTAARDRRDAADLPRGTVPCSCKTWQDHRLDRVWSQGMRGCHDGCRLRPSSGRDLLCA